MSACEYKDKCLMLCCPKHPAGDGPESSTPSSGLLELRLTEMDWRLLASLLNGAVKRVEQAGLENSGFRKLLGLIDKAMATTEPVQTEGGEG